MTIYHWLILVFWLVFVAVWAVSAVGVKRTAGGAWVWWREIGVRVGILALVLLALRMSVFRHAVRSARLYAVNTSPLLGLVGVVLCALGIGCAIAARVHLGRNWGMPMSRKEDPELVTSGPYAYVRHPIYSGILFALLGSAVAQSLFWLLPLVVCVGYFIYSAWREEKLMSEQFPDSYPAYARRTKMLLPFVW
ncbi:MAG TPA: isoprenylcysteine carboxylmethyltransferase family protein [Xanthobacteraceae bacterium]|jgi:protein-S-isoprenylcysteine O-methyltransferase Ste14